MITQTKHKCKSILAIMLAGIGMLLSASFYAGAQVTEATSDQALLKNKNVEQMFEVAQPSTRLELHVEGFDKPIEVSYHNGSPVLYAKGALQEQQQQILDAYTQLTGSENAEVKDTDMHQ